MTIDPSELDISAQAPEPAPAPDWKTTKTGREYVSAVGRHGIVYRVGDETIEQALTRDAARPSDQRPKKKTQTKKAPPPTGTHRSDLREIETVLTEVLRAPAMPCAMVGDSWSADHFTTQGPILSRQLVSSAQHNPWLRRKLEAFSSGDELAVRLMTLSTVAVAAAGYLVPPLIWWLNIPVPDGTRQLFAIPPRRRGADAATNHGPPVAAAA